MNKQDYYDLLVVSAFDGTFPSIDENGLCLYRGPNGTKCGVGILIPDDIYLPNIEGEGVRFICEKYDIIPKNMTPMDIIIVQGYHDRTAKYAEFDFIQKFLSLINNDLRIFDDVIKIKGCPEELLTVPSEL